MFKPKSLALLFGLEILALILYGWHQTISLFVGWEKSRLIFHILILIAFTILFGVGLPILIRTIIRSLKARTGLPLSDLSRSLVLSLSPFSLLLFIFLQYIVFLKNIQGYLLPVSFAGAAYLIITVYIRIKRTYPQAVSSPEFIKRWNPDQISIKYLAMLLFTIALVVYVALASGLVFPPQPFTGDEPHYLLITRSILKDGDINLANNYGDKDYLDFYPGELKVHAYAGKKGYDHLYSKHSPALPLLLVPAYMIGEKVIQFSTEEGEDPKIKRQILIFFSRLPLCLFTALLGLAFFLIVFDVTQRKTLAALMWAIFGFTTPILFYSHLIYSEIPVALITLFVLRNLIFKKESGTIGPLLTGAGIALLPWFGIKYIVLSAILFGVWIVLHRSKILHILSPIVISASLYFHYLWSLYGGYSPLFVYKGRSPDPSTEARVFLFIKTDFAEFLQRSVGYFLDQRTGLFIYSPILILGLAGFFFFLNQRKKLALVLFAVFSAYWIFSAYYYWGGFCPPGRALLPVFSILVLFLALAFNENRNRIRDSIKRVCVALSFLVVWAALKNPWILYHKDLSSDYFGKAMSSNLLNSISNTFISFQKMIPSFVRIERVNWIPLIFWTVIIILMVGIYITKDKTRDSGSISLKMGKQTGTVLFLSFILLTYVFFDIHLEEKNVYAEPGYELYFQDDNHYGKELAGFWTKGKRQTSVILKSNKPVANIHLEWHGLEEGTTTIQVGPAKKNISRSKTKGLAGKVSFPAPKGFPLAKGYLYTITISDTSGFVPYQLDENVRDNRYLGVFIRITIS